MKLPISSLMLVLSLSLPGCANEISRQDFESQSSENESSEYDELLEDQAVRSRAWVRVEESKGCRNVVGLSPQSACQYKVLILSGTRQGQSKTVYLGTQTAGAEAFLATGDIVAVELTALQRTLRGTFSIKLDPQGDYVRLGRLGRYSCGTFWLNGNPGGYSSAGDWCHQANSSVYQEGDTASSADVFLSSDTYGNEAIWPGELVDLNLEKSDTSMGQNPHLAQEPTTRGDLVRVWSDATCGLRNIRGVSGTVCSYQAFVLRNGRSRIATVYLADRAHLKMPRGKLLPLRLRETQAGSNVFVAELPAL